MRTKGHSSRRKLDNIFQGSSEIKINQKYECNNTQKKFPKKIQQLTNYDAGYEASPLRGTSNRVIKECKGDVKSIKNLSTGKSVSEINHTY